ncbi:hypothetical protein H8959_007275 [Pygathrix nigripes]
MASSSHARLSLNPSNATSLLKPECPVTLIIISLSFRMQLGEHFFHETFLLPEGVNRGDHRNQRKSLHCQGQPEPRPRPRASTAPPPGLHGPAPGPPRPRPRASTAPPPAHPSSTALVVLVISGSPGCPGVSLLQAPPRLQAGSRCYGDRRCKLDAWMRRCQSNVDPAHDVGDSCSLPVPRGSRCHGDHRRWLWRTRPRRAPAFAATGGESARPLCPTLPVTHARAGTSRGQGREGTASAPTSRPYNWKAA